jgi:NAD(P)-dependent dehydrogenase (short-subunit alcohol dehydrogenase family)
VSWALADIPDQAGRTAVVTGANGGLGLETARALAAAGASVVIAARNQERAAEAMDRIRTGVPGASLAVVELDLGSLASVRGAAEEILAAHETIDVLVNNAGVMGIPERRTADGFEMQLGVDHLGHFALTALLMPALLRSPAARIVTVTSTAHHMGRAVDPANPHLRGRYRPWRAYGQAKLANFHFGIGLDRRLRASGATAASLIAHPGLSNTELQAVSVAETGGGLSQRFFLMLARRVGMTPADGALSQLRAATDPGARGGEFFGPLFVNSGPPVRKPILRRLGMGRAIERLWEMSERETGLRLEI